MKRCCWGLLFVLGWIQISHAHFPILKLDRVFTGVNQPVALLFAVGHPYEQEYENAAKPDKVTVVLPTGKTEEITANLTEDILNERKENPTIWKGVYTPDQKGDFILALDSHIEFGRRNRAYQQFLKTFIHVEFQDGWRQRSGQPVEIVPLTRPYGLEAGFVFSGQLLKGDQPLSGVQVDIEQLLEEVPDPASLPPEPYITRSVFTDPNGVFTHTLPHSGWWILAAEVDDIGSISHEGQTYTLNGLAAIWVYVQ